MYREEVTEREITVHRAWVAVGRVQEAIRTAEERAPSLVEPLNELLAVRKQQAAAMDRGV